ncbi:bifunctional non-homologous end joining protein LigD [Saccharothrix tamanrassetensis]|uniref:DNA ligase (ATP) n=1 Tax=Saccharothrix tamanrassetensis TaxID=1051531 RepID=A0A841CPV7_9PSEU|nr:non-homologous end-joining DNA ligase [Saccharothrix tamanrassetensis]MBB5960452.1 bifunctional non-homologous end joining protein LigD [Saccharothrix tamanrassetensis]
MGHAARAAAGGEPLVIEPMLATAGEPPVGAGWSAEFKWDGYRAVAHCSGHTVRLLSRNRLNLVDRFPELRILSDLLHERTIVLDGEIVALGPDQRPDFGLLQQRTRSPAVRSLHRVPVAYYVFDLLVLDGRPLTTEPYRLRRRLLTGLSLPGNHPVQVPPSFPDTEPATLLHVAAQYGLEGIVSKRTDSRYEPGRRSPSWIKTPLRHTQEAVVGGWKPGQGRRSDTIGSLLLGAHDDTGLVYIGHVGTGFSHTTLTDLRHRLQGLRRTTSPFSSQIPREHARDAHWVDPVLVGDIEFRQWTTDGRLRHPSWRGLRPDRDPDDVRLPDR